MRKLLFVFLMILPSIVFAQADTTKAKTHEEYCMLVATSKLFSTKVKITIDRGQETHVFGDKGTLRDDDGKVMSFNSVIDALNYMSTKGWLFVNAYALSVADNGTVLNYIMRRPVKK